MKRALCILSFFILLLSCSSHHNEAVFFLNKAQSIIETSPDSATMYLDSILMPKKFLKKDKYMEYLVTNVQAKYKNYDVIKDDTNIFITKSYFDKKVQKSIANSQSLKYQMYAYLYSGCVYDEREEYENAMRDYNTAFTLAEKMQDSLYMRRINNYIAELFVNQTYWNEALMIYKKSVSLANSYADKANSLDNIARMYYMINNADSCKFYINQAVDLAEQTNDNKTLSSVYQSAYVFYKEFKEIGLAGKYLNLSVMCNPNIDSYWDNLYNLNFLSLFLEEGDLDSARIYANKLRNEFKTMGTCHMKTSICDALSDYYHKINIYDSTLYYQKKATYLVQEIYKQIIDNNIYEIQKRYDYELQKNIYQTKLNKRLLLIICILIVLLLVSVISFIIIANSKRKEKTLSNHLKNLNSQKDDLEKSKQEIMVLFNNNLKERIDIIRKANIFEIKNKDNKIVNDIKKYAYGDSNKTAFEASVDVIESSYSNISTFIKDTYPDLNETEYKVCLLSVVPFTTDDIAIIIGLGSDYIRKTRSSIRKKMRINDKKSTISEYVLERYYSSLI